LASEPLALLLLFVGIHKAWDSVSYLFVNLGGTNSDRN